MNLDPRITQKRNLLSTVTFRFSPQIQPIKDTILDRIIEKAMLASNGTKAISEEEIREILASGDCGYSIHLLDLGESLTRLASLGRLEIERQKYILSDAAKSELEHIQTQAERSFTSVIESLFKNAKKGTSKYAEPFLEFLCIIFSRLGEESVKLIKGDTSKEDFLGSSSFNSALKDIVSNFDSVDPDHFKSAAITFFSESNPEYDSIKWNMAQNYYIVKALGLDPSGSLLSEEVFGNSTFYLDTNILIAALEPRLKHHNGFLIFKKACDNLNIKLKVAQITIEELVQAIDYNRDTLEKVIDQIPDGMAHEVRSGFYKIYCDKRKSGEEVNMDDIFTSFKDPRNDLEKLFGIEHEDNDWFNIAIDNSETQGFCEKLKLKYLDMRRRRKGKNAALHDALLMLYINKLREETGENIFLITADLSLPNTTPNTASKSLAVTLDAVLQWISSIHFHGEEGSTFAPTFSEIIKYRLLPQDQILDLEDFLIFHDMQMKCKELPVEDVEGCLRYIKNNLSSIDPSDAFDREKLIYGVSKFFADPGRKYKEEISRLESEKHSNLEEYKKQIDAVHVQQKKLKEKYEEEITERERRIEGLETKFAQFEEEVQKAKFKRSIRNRSFLAFILFLGLDFFAYILATTYGAGDNIVQKILNSWPFFGGAAAIALLSGYFIIGKERFQALGWPFNKIFGKVIG